MVLLDTGVLELSLKIPPTYANNDDGVKKTSLLSCASCIPTANQMNRTLLSPRSKRSDMQKRRQERKDYITLSLLSFKIMQDLRYESNQKLHCILLIEDPTATTASANNNKAQSSSSTTGGKSKKERKSQSSSKAYSIEGQTMISIFIGFKSKETAMNWKTTMENLVMDIRKSEETKAQSLALQMEQAMKSYELSVFRAMLSFLDIPDERNGEEDDDSEKKNKNLAANAITSMISTITIKKKNQKAIKGNAIQHPRQWYKSRPCPECTKQTISSTQSNKDALVEFTRFTHEAFVEVIIPFVKSMNSDTHDDAIYFGKTALESRVNRQAPRWFADRIVELNDVRYQSKLFTYKEVIFWCESKYDKTMSSTALRNYAKVLSSYLIQDFISSQDKGSFSNKKSKRPQEIYNNFDRCIPFSNFIETDDYICLAVAPPSPTCIFKRLFASSTDSMKMDPIKLRKYARYFDLPTPPSTLNATLYQKYTNIVSNLGIRFSIGPQDASEGGDYDKLLNVLKIEYSSTEGMKILHGAKLLGWCSMLPPLIFSLRESDSIKLAVIIEKENDGNIKSKVIPLDYSTWRGELSLLLGNQESNSSNQHNYLLPESISSQLAIYESSNKTVAVLNRLLLPNSLDEKGIRIEYNTAALLPAPMTSNPVPPNKSQLVFMRRLVLSHFSPLSIRPELVSSASGTIMHQNESISTIIDNFYTTINERTTNEALYFAKLAHSSGISNCLRDFADLFYSSKKHLTPRVVFVQSTLNNQDLFKTGHQIRCALHASGMNARFISMLANHNFVRESTKRVILYEMARIATNQSPKSVAYVLDLLSSVSKFNKKFIYPFIQAGNLPFSIPDDSFMNDMKLTVNSLRGSIISNCFRFKTIDIKSLWKVLDNDEHGVESLSSLASGQSSILYTSRKTLRAKSLSMLSEIASAFDSKNQTETKKPVQITEMNFSAQQKEPLIGVTTARLFHPEVNISVEARHAAVEHKEVDSSKSFLFFDVYSQYLSDCLRSSIYPFELDISEGSENGDDHDGDVWWKTIKKAVLSWLLASYLQVNKSNTVSCDAIDRAMSMLLESAMDFISPSASQPLMKYSLNSMNLPPRYDQLSAAALGDLSIRSEIVVAIVSLRAALSLLQNKNNSDSYGDVVRLVKILRHAFNQLCVDKSTSPRDHVVYAINSLMVIRAALLWFLSNYNDSKKNSTSHEDLCLNHIKKMIQTNETDLSSIVISQICEDCKNKSLESLLVGRDTIKRDSDCIVCKTFASGGGGFVGYILQSMCIYKQVKKQEQQDQSEGKFSAFLKFLHIESEATITQTEVVMQRVKIPRMNLSLTMLSEPNYSSSGDLFNNYFHPNPNDFQISSTGNINSYMNNDLVMNNDNKSVQGVYIWGNIMGLSLEDESKLRTNYSISSKSLNSAINSKIAMNKIPNFSSNIKIKMISCGHRHTALVTESGLVMTFGYGEGGRLGHGDNESVEQPKIVQTLVSAGMRATHVSCGREHTVAVGDMLLPTQNQLEGSMIRKGLVFSWGWGEAGRLGVGDVGIQSVPVLVEYLAFSYRDAPPTNINGDEIVLSLPKKANTSNSGSKKSSLPPLPPVKATQNASKSEPISTYQYIEIKKVACGREHTLCIDSIGKVYVFGAAGFGRLGQDNHRDDCLYPTLIKGEHIDDQEIVDVSAGDSHSLALCADGTVLSWGFGESGALGHGDFKHVYKPKPIQGLFGQKIISISCGTYHSGATDSKGNGWTWGDGTFGQLGYVTVHGLDLNLDESAMSTSLIKCCNVPKKVNSSELLTELGTPLPKIEHDNVKFARIICGETMTLGLTTAGLLFEWGFTEPEAPDEGAGLAKYKFPRYPERLVPTLIKYSKLSFESHIIDVSAGGCHIGVVMGEKSIMVQEKRMLDERYEMNQLPNQQQRYSEGKQVFICGHRIKKERISLSKLRQSELEALGIWSCQCRDCSYDYPSLSDEFSFDETTSAHIPVPLTCLNGKDIISASIIDGISKNEDHVFVVTKSGMMLDVNVQKDKYEQHPLYSSCLYNDGHFNIKHIETNPNGFCEILASYLEWQPGTSSKKNTVRNCVIKFSLNDDIPYTYSRMTPSLDMWAENISMAQVSLGSNCELFLDGDGKVFQSVFDVSKYKNRTDFSLQRLQALQRLEAVSTPSQKTALEKAKRSMEKGKKRLYNMHQTTGVSSQTITSISTRSFVEVDVNNLPKSNRDTYQPKDSATIFEDENTDNEEEDNNGNNTSDDDDEEEKQDIWDMKSAQHKTMSSKASSRSSNSNAEDQKRSERLSSKVFNLYQSHSPGMLEQRGFLGHLLKQYQGREESLISLLIQKFSPEMEERFWKYPTPIPFEPNISILRIACGGHQCLAVSSTGNVFSWINQSANNNSNEEPKHIVPDIMQFPEESTVIKDVACGEGHCLALSQSGIVYSWGSNTFGQLGLGTRKAMSNPTKIESGGILASKISCGATHSLIVSQDGSECWAFGNGRNGRLGIGYETKSTDQLLPAKVMIRGKIVDVHAGAKTSMFIVQ